MKWIRLLVLLAFFSCDESTPSSPNPADTFSSTSSFNANLSASEPVSNYDAEHKAIRRLGATGVQTAAPWKSLNSTGTVYDLTPLTNTYFGLSKLSEYGYKSIFLNIPIITINTRSMPTDIASLSFDDPLVKARFRALIDAIKIHLNDKVKYISLGNEVDTYLGAHPGEWTAFTNLVTDAKNYLKTIRPDILVGVTTTFSGATSGFGAEVDILNLNMDVLMLTYYPVTNTFAPRPPDTVADDIAKMVDVSQGKPIIMQEWGYPSSSAIGSSEVLQAEFMFNSFVELEKQGSVKFPFVSFFKYRDWSTSHVQTITGQQAGQPFFEFMSSLGVKKNDGTTKEAFKVIENWIKP